MNWVIRCQSEPPLYFLGDTWQWTHELERAKQFPSEQSALEQIGQWDSDTRAVSMFEAVELPE